MSSLTQRVITAAVLVPLVLWGIVALPNPYFALLFAAFSTLGAWEWSALAGQAAPRQRALYLLAFVPGLALAYYLSQADWGLSLILGLGLLWWLQAVVLVGRHQARGQWPPASSVWRGGAGWLVLIPSWVALVSLHGYPERGPYLVVFLLALVWCADIAAFFAGRRWGRHRLASRVSPGKSWEGVGGALAAVALLAAMTGGLSGLGAGRTVLFVLLALLTASASVLGDLTESLFKRQAGVKDSGRLLPGHGGVLDRIDSLTAAAPLFALGVLWLGE
jgi:phosphatidate cytidylyltransferase